MRFEVYCDEANPDVLTSSSPSAQFLMIGSLWLPDSLRKQVKREINQLRSRHTVWGEFKWSKVSPNKQDFYFHLIDLFCYHAENLRFRCIAIDRSQLNLNLHDNDGELGFYKFYYQLLHHWILDFNEYRIFCDAKTNRDPRRLPILNRCLSRSNLSSTIESIQSIHSRESALIQFCDLLLGAASGRVNQKLNKGTIKSKLVERLESKLGRELAPTHKTEEKFNIFKMRMQGGW